MDELEGSVSPGFKWATSKEAKKSGWFLIRQDVTCNKCQQKMTVHNEDSILTCPRCQKAFSVKEI